MMMMMTRRSDYSKVVEDEKVVDASLIMLIMIMTIPQVSMLLIMVLGLMMMTKTFNLIFSKIIIFNNGTYDE